MPSTAANGNARLGCADSMSTRAFAPISAASRSARTPNSRILAESQTRPLKFADSFLERCALGVHRVNRAEKRFRLRGRDLGRRLGKLLLITVRLGGHLDREWKWLGA